MNQVPYFPLKRVKAIPKPSLSQQSKETLSIATFVTLLQLHVLPWLILLLIACCTALGGSVVCWLFWDSRCSGQYHSYPASPHVPLAPIFQFCSSVYSEEEINVEGKRGSATVVAPFLLGYLAFSCWKLHARQFPSATDFPDSARKLYRENRQWENLLQPSLIANKENLSV